MPESAPLTLTVPAPFNLSHSRTEQVNVQEFESLANIVS